MGDEITVGEFKKILSKYPDNTKLSFTRIEEKWQGGNAVPVDIKSINEIDEKHLEIIMG